MGGAQQPVPLPYAVDDQLVRRCQAGDREAFREVVETYGDVLFGTALLMTGDRSLAEDLTQEAFVNAWRGMKGFRSGAPLKPWLTRILVNRVTSHRRRKLLDILPLPFGSDVPDESDPTTEAQRREERDEVRAALSLLPFDQRRVVVLRFYAELSVPEIAKATGVAEGTVKSRLHRALGRLRELLAANGLAPERGVAR